MACRDGQPAAGGGTFGWSRWAGGNGTVQAGPFPAGEAVREFASDVGRTSSWFTLEIPERLVAPQWVWVTDGLFLCGPLAGAGFKWTLGPVGLCGVPGDDLDTPCDLVVRGLL